MVATISFWDSYQFRQDLKSWRRRHGPADTCRPQRVRIASVLQNLCRCLTPPSILNGEKTKNTNKNATSHFVKVLFFPPFFYHSEAHSEKNVVVCLESAICFRFVVWFIRARAFPFCFFRCCFFFKRSIAPFGTKLLISICYSECVL